MKLIIFAGFLLAMATQAVAQRMYTKNGFISFYSNTSLEKISAENNQVTAVLDTQTGDLQFSLPIRGFRFEKALMEEHFNENYLESDKYPKAQFKGVISDWKKIPGGRDGKYPVNVSGQLTIHGVTKTVNAGGTIMLNAGKITGQSVFIVKLADYQISVPRLVRNNISETVEITVNCLFDHPLP